MPYEEEQLNGRIASYLRSLTSDLGWHIKEETTGTFAESAGKKPDIVIRRASGPPIVIENEYEPAQNLEKECLDRLGYTVVPFGSHSGGKVSVVFAIRSPRDLKNCEHSDQADVMLRDGAEFRYAVYASEKSGLARFPSNGFIKGDIRNFVEFMKPASVPQDEVDRAATALSNGASEAAAVLARHSKETGFGVSIGEMLRQPWPRYEGIPNTRREIEQDQADEDARLQTATMCAVILINALAYQQNLSSYHDDIDDIAQALERKGVSQLTKRVVTDEWESILKVNYWPIFHIARQLLLKIPHNTAIEILDSMVDTADDIQSAMRQHDVAGIVFQRLIADRKTLKTYYTLPASTVLAATLGVHDDKDWSNPDVVKNYSMADYACGTGGLILAAYQRVRNLHRYHGGEPNDLHSHMMENSLTACDIMPAAVHLSSSLLSSVAPNKRFEGTRNILYPFGGRKQRDNEGNIVIGADGNPVLERDAKDQPAVDIGSLELLDVNVTKRQVVLPISEQMALGAKGEVKPIEVDMAPMSEDLVIMNPPFTRPTNHAPFNASDHVQPKNPAFAAFGTSDEEQRAMKAKERDLGRGTISDGNAGLGTTFTAIAHNMVKPGGRIALILPTSAMMGGSYDSVKGQAYSWQRLRNLLHDRYDEIVVVSVSQPAQRDSAFSADSDYADCIVTARRATTARDQRRLAHFVNLKKRPGTTLEAQETARAIRVAIKQTTEIGKHNEVCVGDEVVGFVIMDEAPSNQKWTGVRVANPTLLERVRNLTGGTLALPQRRENVAVPMTRVRHVGKVGPIARDITEPARGPFTKKNGYTAGNEYPMLWSHNNRGGCRQDTMLTCPDSHGIVRDGFESAAAQIWESASNLHINANFRFNANSMFASWTERKSLGGFTWPSLLVANADHAKALCVWWNGTLGMASYWLESNRTQNGRGRTSVTAIPNLPVLNVSALPPNRVAAAVRIFDDLKDSTMLPANEAYRDDVRQDLDKRILIDMLGLDEESVDQLTILRDQWCAEPTVSGTKRTSIVYNSQQRTT